MNLKSLGRNFSNLCLISRVEGLGSFRAKWSASNPLKKNHCMSEYCLILIPNSSLLGQTLAQTKVANPTPSFLFLFYNTPIYPLNLSVWNEVYNNNSNNNKNQAHFCACSLFISRKRLYFPWDRIYWIEEGLSNCGKTLIIRSDLLKPVSIKLKESHGKA